MGPILLDLRKGDGSNANLRALAAAGYQLQMADGGYVLATPPGLTLGGQPAAEPVPAPDAAPAKEG